MDILQNHNLSRRRDLRAAYSRNFGLVKVERRSKRSVCRQFNIHLDTLVKILEHTEPPGYRQTQPRTKRKIGPFLEIIDEILEGDKTVHRKQHHTARRIFDRLKDEHGYPGGCTAVKEVVRDRRLRQREVFMPLSHRPGEAQIDFGAADVIWEGHERRVGDRLDDLGFSPSRL